MRFRMAVRRSVRLRFRIGEQLSRKTGRYVLHAVLVTEPGKSYCNQTKVHGTQIPVEVWGASDSYWCQKCQSMIEMSEHLCDAADLAGMGTFDSSTGVWRQEA